MSRLELVAEPVERIAADVLVVPLFEGEIPLREAAGRVDWRLCGRLSQLAAAGELPCALGEAMLTPGGGGVRAPRVLGLGLGARSGLDGDRWQDWSAAALERAGRLRAPRVALALPACGEPLGERLARLASAASGATAEQVTLAPEPRDLPAALQWFRRAARRAQAGGLEVVPPVEVRTPRGVDPGPGRAEAPAQPSRSSHAPTGRFTR